MGSQSAHLVKCSDTILYMSCYDTHVIMNANGSERLVLQTGLELEGGRSDWSGNGRWLTTYAGQPNDRDIDLIVIDGSEIRRLTFTGDNLAPSFSPDGNWLVFTSARDGDNELYILRLDGTGLMQLTDNEIADWQPRWGR
jgi:TolB protein